jgi:hypothetical protein
MTSPLDMVEVTGIESEILLFTDYHKMSQLLILLVI